MLYEITDSSFVEVNSLRLLYTFHASHSDIIVFNLAINCFRINEKMVNAAAGMEKKLNVPPFFSRQFELSMAFARLWRHTVFALHLSNQRIFFYDRYLIKLVARCGGPEKRELLATWWCVLGLRFTMDVHVGWAPVRIYATQIFITFSFGGGGTQWHYQRKKNERTKRKEQKKYICMKM